MKLAITAAALTLAAGAALAQDAPAVEDTNGDGTYTIEELTAAYPTLTPETFATIDLDASGSVDAEELASAQANGTLTQG